MEFKKIELLEFTKIFEEAGLEEAFPLIGRSYKSCCAEGNKPSVYTAVENENIIGVAICIKRHKSGGAYINLFEIRQGYRRRGIGRQLYSFALKDIGDIPITLRYAGKRGGEAYLFWVKMGFVQRHRDGRSHEMINKKYAFLANRNRQGIPIVAKRVITEKNGVIDVKEIDYRNESH